MSLRVNDLIKSENMANYVAKLSSNEKEKNLQNCLTHSGWVRLRREWKSDQRYVLCVVTLIVRFLRLANVNLNQGSAGKCWISCQVLVNQLAFVTIYTVFVCRLTCNACNFRRLSEFDRCYILMVTWRSVNVDGLFCCQRTFDGFLFEQPILI